MKGYLNTKIKAECCGCEACVQICTKAAIKMQEDREGFRYPIIKENLCVHCGMCNMVCQYENIPEKNTDEKYVFGGYIKDRKVRFNSTSGGAFSAIAEEYCDENYVIFGAASRGLTVYHSYITDILKLGIFRKSKYSQSVIGDSYTQCKRFLRDGKKVIFSGTPCQIAGLKKFLGSYEYENLLTVEVVCEGVPSPLYIRKLDENFSTAYKSRIKNLDYRYTGKSFFANGKWDFELMKIKLENGKNLRKDRWFNPFWSLWLEHLMTRPSCYNCQYTTTDRVADITLGDLWGVHLYCPELYGKNGGSSLVVANTEKGRKAVLKAQEKMFGHKLQFEQALKYQSPMRKTISENTKRNTFMKDLESSMTFDEINKKWYKLPTIKLLCQKYLWGNRQKIFLWNIKDKKGH